jgi:hypothetical protein
MPFQVPVVLTREYGPVSGKLDPSTLVVGGTGQWVLWEPAARCHRAMMAAARAAGHVPRSTGTYRSYDRQVALFKERYSHVDTGVGRKFWSSVYGGDNRYWWKIQNPVTKKYPADAATPGTSEHGWGCADDIAEELDGDAAVEAIGAAFVAWLRANASRYGFENTNPTEPWHWAYCLGGLIPIAVLAYETPDVPPTQGARPMQYVIKGATGTAVYVTDWLTKRHIDGPTYDLFRVLSTDPANGIRMNNGAFFELADTIVDAIPVVNGGGPDGPPADVIADEVAAELARRLVA